MTPREIVFQALDLKATQRAPVTWFGGGIWTVYNNSPETFVSLSENTKKMTRVILNTYKRIQTDIVYVGSGYNNFLVSALGGKIRYRKVGNPDLEKPIVNQEEDLNYLSLNNIDNSSVIKTVRETTKNIQKEIGEEAAVTATSWGPFTLAGQLYGVENLMRSIYRNGNFVKRIVEFAVRLIIRFYRPLLKERIIKLISIAEPAAAGNLISREQFEEFALPAIKKLISWASSQNARVFLHICGNTEDRLDFIRDSQVDCFSIDNKVSLEIAKEKLSGKVCLAGNIDPVNVLLKGGREEVEKAVERCLEIAGKNGGYILMPGCDLPPNVPEENIRVFLETGRKWRCA
jgi:uroporphyrinogen decarboxylase